MSDIFLINGKKPDDLRSFSFPIFTPGIPFQNAFFETLKYENGRLPFWQDHVSRIKKGFVFYKRDLFCNLEVLYDYIITNCKNESFKYSKVKLVFDLSLNNFYIGIREYKKSIIEEMSTPLIISVYNEKYSSKRNNKIKLGSYGFQKKALIKKPDIIDEFLLVDQNDIFIEGLFSNLMWVNNDVLYFVNEEQCILNGLMQNKIIDLCHKIGIKTISKSGLCKGECQNTESLLLCNMVKGVRYVKELNGRKFNTHKIINKLQESLLTELED